MQLTANMIFEAAQSYNQYPEDPGNCKNAKEYAEKIVRVLDDQLKMEYNDKILDIPSLQAFIKVNGKQIFICEREQGSSELIIEEDFEQHWEEYKKLISDYLYQEMKYWRQRAAEKLGFDPDDDDPLNLFGGNDED